MYLITQPVRLSPPVEDQMLTTSEVFCPLSNRSLSLMYWAWLSEESPHVELTSASSGLRQRRKLSIKCSESVFAISKRSSASRKPAIPGVMFFGVIDICPETKGILTTNRSAIMGQSRILRPGDRVLRQVRPILWPMASCAVLIVRVALARRLAKLLKLYAGHRIYSTQEGARGAACARLRGGNL